MTLAVSFSARFRIRARRDRGSGSNADDVPRCPTEIDDATVYRPSNAPTSITTCPGAGSNQLTGSYRSKRSHCSIDSGSTTSYRSPCGERRTVPSRLRGKRVQ